MADVRNTSIPSAIFRPAAEPVTFDRTVGLFSSPRTGADPFSFAVLFASPWGLEEMCTRKFWRIIAEKLADRGIASLRFDYSGTGDALDRVDFESGLSVWSDSLVAASDQLKALSGCENIVVISQGLGAVITAKAAADLPGLAAIAFLAPVVSGRQHLRELAVWSRVVDENLGLSQEQRVSDRVSIASFTMPSGVAEEVRKINLTALDNSPAPLALVVGRVDRPADREFAARLQSLGIEVTEQVFEGYDQLVSNPAISKLPLRAADRLVDWAASLPSTTGQSSVSPPVASAKPLTGDGFRELPVRLGKGDRLFGVVCEPLQPRMGATVLFLTSAYDRHAGWGRTTVMMARALARSGIASLRFDTANAGDSPPVLGLPEQVLYDSCQNADVSEAVDYLESRGLGPVVAAGRCSGAYLGLQAALTDARIVGVVSVNPAVFRWRPGRSVEEAIVKGTRRLEDYGQRVLRTETFRRLLRGEIDIRRAGVNILKGVSARIANRLLHAFRGILPEGQAIYAMFRTLRQRGVPVALIYSENDLGLEQHDFYFGHDGSGFARFPDVTSTIIPNADHNLTPEHARAAYLKAVEEMALRVTRSRRPEDEISERDGPLAA